MNERQIGTILFRNHGGIQEQAVQETPWKGLQANGPLILALSKVKGKYSGLARTGHSLEVSRLDTEIHLPSCRWILINNLM